jgi:hypothetical protein
MTAVATEVPAGGFYRDFGLLIKFARLDKGWAQVDVGIAVGISTTALGRWENGQTAPLPQVRQRVIPLLSRKLGLSESLLETEALKAYESLQYGKQRIWFKCRQGHPHQVDGVCEVCRSDMINNPQDPRHGLAGYQHWRCPCDVCRHAVLAHKRVAAHHSRRRLLHDATSNHHGTHYGYSLGCRCDFCRSAQRAYRAQRGEGLRRNESDPRHGTTTGYGLGCRCQDCKTARLRDRSRIAERFIQDSTDYRHGTITGYGIGCHCDACENANHLDWLRRREKRGLPTRRYRFVTAWGETKTVTDWSRDPRCMVGYAAFEKRVRLGWKPETALTHPSERKQSDRGRK